MGWLRSWSWRTMHSHRKEFDSFFFFFFLWNWMSSRGFKSKKISVWVLEPIACVIMFKALHLSLCSLTWEMHIVNTQPYNLLWAVRQLYVTYIWSLIPNQERKEMQKECVCVCRCRVWRAGGSAGCGAFWIWQLIGLSTKFELSFSFWFMARLHFLPLKN